MLKSLPFAVVILVAFPPRASALESEDLKSQILTIQKLNCSGATPTALVAGILDQQMVDQTEVILSTAMCAKVENMIKQYEGRACARKAQFSVRKTTERGIFSNAYTFELTQIEDDSPLFKGERKVDYCAQRPSNFRQAGPMLFVGARPGAEDFAYLKTKNIHTIVNLQGGNYNWNGYAAYAVNKLEPGESPAAIAGEAKLAASSGMRSVSDPMLSIYVSDQDVRAIDQALKVIANAQEPVYLHCEHGVDRSGLIEAIYRVQMLKQSPSEALDLWESVRATRPAASYLSTRLVDYFKKRFSLP